MKPFMVICGAMWWLCSIGLMFIVKAYIVICGAMWRCVKDSGAYQDNRCENGHDIVGMYEELQPCPKCGDIEHQMTATNDNTSVFCQECGHHYIDMGE